MAKYEPLTEYLLKQKVNSVPMNFAEIEGVLGRELPLSAVSHRAWWSNNPSNNVMTKAWLDAGFQSEQVDIPGRRLVFRRFKNNTSLTVSPVVPDSSAPPATGRSPKLALFGWLRGTVSVAADTNLTDPADPEWGQRVDDEHPPFA